MKNLSPERLEYLLSNMPTDMSFYEQKIKEIGLFDYDGIYATDVRTGMLRYAREAEERNQYAANKLLIAFENVWEAEKTGAAKLREIREELEQYSAYIQRLGNALNTDNGLSADKKKKYISEISTLVKNNTNLEENQETENIIDFFLTCDSKTQLIIQILDRKMVEELGITDIEERKRIIKTLLNEEPNIFMQMYILNAYSGTDFETVIKIVIENIRKRYNGLTEKGKLFLYELELGDKEGWDVNELLKIDEDGDIIEIKIHNVNDGGCTLGPGIYINEEIFPDRIEMAESLGIKWNDYNEWVPIEKVEIMFEYIYPTYHKIVRYIEKETGIFFTEEEYAAVFSMIYLRQALKDNIIYLINSNAVGEEWYRNIMAELEGISYYSENSGWDRRVRRAVDLYHEGIY